MVRWILLEQGGAWTVRELDSGRDVLEGERCIALGAFRKARRELSRGLGVGPGQLPMATRPGEVTLARSER